MSNERSQSNPPKILSGSELDWHGAEQAARALLKQCQDAQFIPPEALGMHFARLLLVCEAMNAIADKLKLRGSPPP